MKNKAQFLTMATAVFFLLFTSCDKDKDLLDQDDSEKTESIIGKWNIDKAVSQETPGETETENGVSGEWIDFRKDGKVVVRTKDRDTGEFEEDEPTSWKVQGDKLIIDGDEEFTIIKLTKQEFVFQEQEIYQDEDGKDIKWVYTMYLKK